MGRQQRLIPDSSARLAMGITVELASCIAVRGKVEGDFDP
jgi:hypothetical protein